MVKLVPVALSAVELLHTVRVTAVPSVPFATGPKSSGDGVTLIGPAAAPWTFAVSVMVASAATAVTLPAFATGVLDCGVNWTTMVQYGIVLLTCSVPV